MIEMVGYPAIVMDAREATEGPCLKEHVHPILSVRLSRRTVLRENMAAVL